MMMMGDSDEEDKKPVMDIDKQQDLHLDEEGTTVTLSKGTARKLQDHLTNFDQVNMALSLEPDNPDLQRLRLDLLELIRLVAKELVGSSSLPLPEEEEKAPEEPVPTPPKTSWEMFHDICTHCWGKDTGHMFRDCPLPKKKCDWSPEMRAAVSSNRWAHKLAHPEHWEGRKQKKRFNTKRHRLMRKSLGGGVVTNAGALTGRRSGNGALTMKSTVSSPPSVLG